jgi:hypothetical protein
VTVFKPKVCVAATQTFLECVMRNSLVLTSFGLKFWAKYNFAVPYIVNRSSSNTGHCVDSDWEERGYMIFGANFDHETNVSVSHIPLKFFISGNTLSPS